METRTEPEPKSAPDLNQELGKFLREHWPDAAAKAKAAVFGTGAIAALNSRASATAAPEGPDFDPQIVRLVNRVCGGFVYSEYQLASQLGFTGYREHHLDYLNIPDTEVDQKLPQLSLGTQLLTLTPKQMHQYTGGPQPFRIGFRALTATRAVLTKRMLFERLAEFWTDHLNIYIEKIQNMGYLKPYDDRMVIRPEALGSFTNMLSQSGKSPAMLAYLDNNENECQLVGGVPGGFNENYARELLELHTLGVNAGYTEDDVKKVAQCLAGWTTPENAADPNFGTFVYDANAHYCGGVGPEVQIYGFWVPAGGLSQGETVLTRLGSRLATASFVSRKLINWLLRYDADAGPTEAAAEAYGDNGNVKEMVRAILAPGPIEQVNIDGADKVKRPYGFAVNFLRSLPALLDFTTGAPNNTTPLLVLAEIELAELNNAPYSWAPPNGYPDNESAWTSNMLGRWMLVWKILTHQVTGIYFTEDDLVGFVLSLGPLGSGGFGQRMNDLLTGARMPTSEVQLVDAFFAYGASQGWALNDLLRGGIALAASTPTYQKY